MFTLTFLGTAASAPSPSRGLSSLLIQHAGRRYLVDCGEGTQRQMLLGGVGLRRLEAVLLTHGHLDHLLGLGGLASTLGLWKAARTLAIYGGKEPLRLARLLLEQVVWAGTTPNIALEYHAVSCGPVLDRTELSISAFPVRHRARDCFGYRFQSAGRRRLRVDRAQALGVPNGPQRAVLVAGGAVTLPGGRVVTPDEVLGPEQAGVSVAVLGDAGSTDDLIAAVSGVDLLVSEATFLDRDADKAAERLHLTAAQAARLARDAGVGHLCLTHLSDRYDRAAILAEATAIFPATTLAEDYLTLQVTSAGVATPPPAARPVTSVSPLDCRPESQAAG